MPNITNVNEFNAIPADPLDGTVYTVTKSFSMATAVSHTISTQITFTAADDVVLNDIRRPLFIEVGNDSVISNIHLKDIKIVDHTSLYLGAIICFANRINLIDCSVESGYIKGDYNDIGFAEVGGIAGSLGEFSGPPSSTSVVQGCKNIGVAVEGVRAGGIAAHMYRVEISNCKNSGNVTASTLKTTSQYATGAGGMCGELYGYSSCTNCSNTGRIRGDSIVGGIIGSSEFGPMKSITLCKNSGNCYSKGAVGGIIGSMLEEGNIDRNINSGKIVSEQGDAGGIIAYVGMYQLNFTLNDNVVTESCTITGEHSCAGIAASLNLTDNGGVVEVKNNWACCASIKCTGDPNYGVAGYRIYNHDYPWYMSFNPVSNNRANENMRLTVISNDPDDSYNNEKVTPSSPYYGADDRQGESTDECPVYCVTIKYSGSTAQLGKPPQPVKARLGATYYPSGSPGTLRRAGYVLCGWSAVPGGPALSSFTARDNATLYPVWKRNMFFDIMNCGGCGCVDIYSDEYRCKKVKGD